MLKSSSVKNSKKTTWQTLVNDLTLPMQNEEYLYSDKSILAIDVDAPICSLNAVVREVVQNLPHNQHMVSSEFDGNLLRVSAELEEFLFDICSQIQTHKPVQLQTSTPTRGELMLSSSTLSSSPTTQVHEEQDDVVLNQWTGIANKILSLTTPVFQAAQGVSQESHAVSSASSFNTICQTIEVTGTALGLLGQLTHNPKLAKMPAIAKSTSSIVQGMGKMIAGGISIGGIGLVLGGVSGLVGCFQSNGQAKAMKVIAKQLKCISVQINSMHQDLRQQFSLTIQALDIIHQDMFVGFMQLAKQQDKLVETIQTMADRQAEFFHRQQSGMAAVYEEQQRKGQHIDHDLQDLALAPIRKRLRNIHFNCETQQASLETYRENFFKILLIANEDAKRAAFLGSHCHHQHWRHWFSTQHENASPIKSAFQIDAIKQTLQFLVSQTELENNTPINPILWISAMDAWISLQQSQSVAIAPLSQEQKQIYKARLIDIIAEGENTLKMMNSIDLPAVLSNLTRQHLTCAQEIWLYLDHYKKNKTLERKNEVKERLIAWSEKFNRELANLPKPTFSDYPLQNHHLTQRPMVSVQGTLRSPEIMQYHQLLGQGKVMQKKEEDFNLCQRKWIVECDDLWRAAIKSFTLDEQSNTIYLASFPLIAESETSEMSLQFPVLINTENPQIKTLLLAKLMGILDQFKLCYQFYQNNMGWNLDLNIVYTYQSKTQHYSLASFSLAKDAVHAHYHPDEILSYFICGGLYGFCNQIYTLAEQPTKRERKDRTVTRRYDICFEIEHPPALNTLTLTSTTLSSSIESTQIIKAIEASIENWFLTKQTEQWPLLQDQLVTPGQALYHIHQEYNGILRFTEFLLAMFGEMYCNNFKRHFNMTIENFIQSSLMNTSSDLQQIHLQTLWLYYINSILPTLQQLPDGTSLVCQMEERLEESQALLAIYDAPAADISSGNFRSSNNTEEFERGLKNYHDAKYLMLHDKSQTQNIYSHLKTAKTLFNQCSTNPLAQKKLEKIKQYLTITSGPST